MQEMGVQPLRKRVRADDTISNTSAGNKDRRNSGRGMHRKKKKHRSNTKQASPTLSEEALRRNLADVNAGLADIYGTSKPLCRNDNKAVETPPFEIMKTGPVRPNSIFTAQAIDAVTIASYRNDGIRRQLVPESKEKTVELCIGLDFGTSCTKVVVGDKNYGKAYAIPLVEQKGLGSYLLPSRLWESNDRYSLRQEGRPHRDLKLRLLAERYANEDFEQAAAYLGLVIRLVRGCILSMSQYRKAAIAWKLNLGLPAASYADTELVSRFKVLALAAEAIADKAASHPAKGEVGGICRRVRNSSLDAAIDHYAVDTEIDVVPEISAQVYGFVQSEHFDPKGPNVFMVIDVGAGTVDSSIFHVRKERGGKYGFVYFSNIVGGNGVVNLHRARIDWLSRALTDIDKNGKIASSLDSLRKFSDLLGAYPERIEEYYDGIRISFNANRGNPDWRFFWERCWDQVFSKTVAAIRNRKLTQAQLTQEMPLFLCGGGARMNYYRDLVDRFNGNTGRAWGHVGLRPLGIPKELQADELKRQDYDRLAVAYGLSFLRLGNYIRPLEVPDLPPPADYNPGNEYIGKEQV